MRINRKKMERRGKHNYLLKIITKIQPCYTLGGILLPFSTYTLSLSMDIWAYNSSWTLISDHI